MVRLIAVLACSCVLLGAGGARAGLSDGGFESGDLSGWTSSGFLSAGGGPTSGGPTYETFRAAQAAGTVTADSNAAESSQTTAFDGNGTTGPAVGPTEGNYLAFVSNQTAAGDGTLTGSALSQTFLVPTDALSLVLNLRLLNNDDPLVFSAANDFGGVALTSGATVLAQYNVDLDPNSGADAHVTPDANVGGFWNSTGWLTPTFDLTPLRGQTVTLTAYALNYGGDNYVESRLLLDDVHVTAAVPEPGALALATAVVLAGLATRARPLARRPRGAAR